LLVVANVKYFLESIIKKKHLILSVKRISKKIRHILLNLEF